MGVNTAKAVSNASANLRNQSSKASTGKASKLGKSDFLNLFMTQMANQDPTNPMDSSQMMGNMAQMGVMEQMQNMNKNIEKLLSTQGDVARFGALQMLGKEVAVAGDTLDIFKGKQSSSVYFNLGKEFDQVKVDVKGQNGNIVAKIDMGLLEAGKHQIQWDGKDDYGRPVPDGTYTFLVSAIDEDGEKEFVDTHKAEKVRKVEFIKGEPWLNLMTTNVPAKKALLVENSQ